MDSHTPETSQSIDPRDRMFALWLCVAILLLATRYWTLYIAEITSPQRLSFVPQLPFAFYQDLMVVVVIATIFRGLVSIGSGGKWLWAIRFLAWTVVALTTVYSLISVEVYRLLKAPLTWRLIEMSDRLKGIRSSVDAATDTSKVVPIIMAPLVLFLLAATICRFAPRMLRSVHQACHRWPALILIGCYFCSCHVWARSLVDASVIENPHWCFVRSLWDNPDPFIADVGKADASDFGIRNQLMRKRSSSSNDRPENVILIVLESVGAKYMGVTGGRWNNTPNLDRMMKHGVQYSRIYASHPYTSSAMAGTFCSLYPYHGWRSLLGRSPNVKVPGVADQLKAHGFRSAFLHTGDLSFDNQRVFLESHGFEEVRDISNFPRDSGAPPVNHPDAVGYNMIEDRWLLPAATNWIDQNRANPFFLTLWTIQTHHPYAPSETRYKFETEDRDLNRYLNAIAEADELIGQLEKKLQERGLAEKTLLVVMGDHGDAFGQHGRRVHGQTLYDEEVLVPLLMINPRMWSGPSMLETVGQQIDIAPTILGHLNVAPDSRWQGEDLHSKDPHSRAYLFTAYHHYSFGVVEGNHKYIFDATANRRELYDLTADFNESRNLENALGGPIAKASHQRLAGWFAFQNDFLATLELPSDVRNSKEDQPDPPAGHGHPHIHAN